MFGWLFWVVLFVALLAVVLPERRRRHSESGSPHLMLQRRLARGEITPEQYEQTRVLLDRDGASA
jgi:putative membrane protein